MSIEFSALEADGTLPDGTSFKDTEEPNNKQIEAFNETLWAC